MRKHKISVQDETEAKRLDLLQEHEVKFEREQKARNDRVLNPSCFIGLTTLCTPALTPRCGGRWRCYVDGCSSTMRSCVR
jgi:hypothetical protein